jgi:SAM-dependent methyltransferase
MALEDRERWNQKYLAGWKSSLHKTLLDFYRFAPLGRALEVACGTGENAVFLAKAGFVVDAVDISDIAIQKAKELARKEGVYVNFICADLDHFVPEENAYELVVNFYYLNRSLIPKLKRALKQEGLIIFETYNEKHTLVKKDFNPEYLLKEGELLQLFRDFEVLHYSESFNISTFVGKKLR